MENKTYCALCQIWVNDWKLHLHNSAHQDNVLRSDIDNLPILPPELTKQDAERNIGCPHCGWTGNQGDFHVGTMEMQEIYCPKCGGEFADPDRDNCEYEDASEEEGENE